MEKLSILLVIWKLRKETILDRAIELGAQKLIILGIID